MSHEEQNGASFVGLFVFGAQQRSHQHHFRAGFKKKKKPIQSNQVRQIKNRLGKRHRSPLFDLSSSVLTLFYFVRSLGAWGDWIGGWP